MLQKVVHALTTGLQRFGIEFLRLHELNVFILNTKVVFVSHVKYIVGLTEEVITVRLQALRQCFRWQKIRRYLYKRDCSTEISN